MVAYVYRAPSGIAGSVTRPDVTNVESAYMGTVPPTAFGVPVKMVSGKINAFEAGDTASKFYGILTRVAPSIAGDTAQTLASGTPNPVAMQGVAVRGYVNVVCKIGTPVRGNSAYVRLVAATGKAIGDIEATADVTVVGGTITGTGTGTIAASVTAAAIIGTWRLTLQTTSQTSLVTVIDPNGLRHPDATVGTAYTNGGLTFTITAAGTMTAGDYFTPVVTANNAAIPGVTWASDGFDADKNAEVRIAQ